MSYESTYIVYFCTDGRYKVEKNQGYPIQDERTQYRTKKEAQIQADILNKDGKDERF